MDDVSQKQMTSKVRSKIIELLWLSIIFIFIACVAYILYTIIVPKKIPVTLRTCPLDAQLCPDGSSIGRTGTACTFDCSAHMSPTTNPPTDTHANFLFQRTASWGPCALPDANACHDELTLSQDGMLEISSVKGIVKEKLDPSKLEKIKNHIRTSKLLLLPCTASVIVDYTARYRITLDGTTKDIDFPGCEQDLKVIDDLLNS